MANLKKSETPLKKFEIVVGCVRQNLNNILGAIYVEFCLGTTGRLIQKTSDNDVWYMNGQEFSENYHVKDIFISRLFYPREDSNMFDNLIKMYSSSTVLVNLLENQYILQKDWTEYMTFVQQQQLITYDTVNRLIDIVSTFPFYGFKSKLEKCINQISSNDQEDIFLPLPDQYEILSSAFRNLSPLDFTIDNVSGDGNCFFTSISNQFKEFVQNPDQVSVYKLRSEVQSFVERHIQMFVQNIIPTWKEAWNSDPNSPEWSFFNYFIGKGSDEAIAREMLKEKIFMNSAFYAEEFTIQIVLKYLSEVVLQDRVVLIIIPSDSEPFALQSSTQGYGSKYTFLFKEPNHYSSIAIQDRRLFAQIPPLSFDISKKTQTAFLGVSW